MITSVLEEKSSTQATAQSHSDKPAKTIRRAARKGKAASTVARRKSASRAEAKATSARRGSKTSKVLSLLQRPKGAALNELTKATGWQAHSVRGFLSGTLRKKMGLQVASAKSADGERRYSLSR